MLISADQLVLHAVGDYVLQSDWMANEKTKKWLAAFAHALTYSIVFLLATHSVLALVIIFVTHLLVDRFRLARYVCWAKNFLAPRKWHHQWSECSGTGYHKDRPPWMSVWLMIIADNTIHVICNGLALHYFGD